MNAVVKTLIRLLRSIKKAMHAKRAADKEQPGQFVAKWEQIHLVNQKELLTNVF